jgi:hypothetical protein
VEDINRLCSEYAYESFLTFFFSFVSKSNQTFVSKCKNREMLPMQDLREFRQGQVTWRPSGTKKQRSEHFVVDEKQVEHFGTLIELIDAAVQSCDSQKFKKLLSSQSRESLELCRVREFVPYNHHESGEVTKSSLVQAVCHSHLSLLKVLLDSGDTAMRSSKMRISLVGW